MSGESRTKRKWWHGTLNINDRENGNTISTITSADSSFPYLNASPYSVFAFPDFSCEPANIPVPAFYHSQSPGYFVFRPSSIDLGSSIVNIRTYQDAINLNNRRVFEFKITAAYSNCGELSPVLYDSFAHETVVNELNSNVFKYPTIVPYNQIGCCVIELSSPSTDLPPKGRIGRATRVWYLTRRDNITNPGTYIYSIYSYDFALTTGALVFRGDVDVSIEPSIRLYDITWIPSDNSLIVLTSSGIRRIFPGSDNANAILGNNIAITGVNSPYTLFPILSNVEDSYVPKMEYNLYEDALYVFYPVTYGTTSPTTYPAILKFEYSDRTGLRLTSNGFISASFDDNRYLIGDLAFSQNFQSDPRAYCALNGNLSRIDSFGTIDSSQFSNGQFSGMFTMSFIQNPDPLVADNLMYTTNEAGQVFSVNLVQGITVDSLISLGASPIGAASTINGEDARISLFPFALGPSHWLFLIDKSSGMSDGNRLERIKAALRNMMSSYVRYGDKITLIGFNDVEPIRVTKILNTRADANEVLSFVETFFVPSGSSAKLCTLLPQLSQQFNDVKSMFILSAGSFSDCGSNMTAWYTSVYTPLASFANSNPGVRIVSVGVSPSDPTILQFIASYFGTYVDWR